MGIRGWMWAIDFRGMYVVKELASHLIDFSVSRLRLRIGVILAPWRSAVGPTSTLSMRGSSH